MLGLGIGIILMTWGAFDESWGVFWVGSGITLLAVLF